MPRRRKEKRFSVFVWYSEYTIKSWKRHFFTWILYVHYMKIILYRRNWNIYLRFFWRLRLRQTALGSWKMPSTWTWCAEWVCIWILNLLCTKIYIQQSVMHANSKNDERFGIDARDWAASNNWIWYFLINGCFTVGMSIRVPIHVSQNSL